MGITLVDSRGDRSIAMISMKKSYFVIYSLTLLQLSIGCNPVADPNVEDMDGPIVDWNQYQTAAEAFSTCESNGAEGLTWQEIEACEEEHSSHCEATQCLTEYAFNEMDVDNDGILTWAEYAVVNMAILNMLAPELCQHQTN